MNLPLRIIALIATAIIALLSLVLAPSLGLMRFFQLANPSAPTSSPRPLHASTQAHRSALPIDEQDGGFIRFRS